MWWFVCVYECGHRVIDIPHSVEELCDESFSSCDTVCRAVFCESSSLKWIGCEALSWSNLIC